MVAGQPEDISVVLSNFNAIATTINGNLDDANVKATAGIALTKLASAGQIGASGVVIGASSITFGGDTNLYRFGAATLKTDGALISSGTQTTTINGLRVTNPTAAKTATMWMTDGGITWFEYTGLLGSILGYDSTGKVYLGATDTSLSRTAAGTLRADSILQVGLDIYAQTGLSTQLRMGNSSGVPTIEFGSALDTRIYRNAAGSLKTDGQLIVASQILVGGITDPNGAPHLGLANSGGALATPTGGGVLFVDSGALKYRGSSGSLTTVAPA